MTPVLRSLSVLLLLATSGSAMAEGHHAVVPLDKVAWEQDDDVKCLSSALETGDPATGPSTIILKAPPNCVVRWHYHTAREELIVAKGTTHTEMEGVPATRLGPGGYAVMAGKQKHQFTCVSATECILFVTFDAKYDIFWVKEK